MTLPADSKDSTHSLEFVLDVPRLLADIRRDLEIQLNAILNDFESAPSRAGLFEVGVIAEVVTLARDLPSARVFVKLLGAASTRWAQSGLLEDLCFCESKLIYFSALLLSLTEQAPLEVFSVLSRHGLIGRSEYGGLTQLFISAMLSCRDENPILPQLELASLTINIDKRCLQSRTNELDLSSLMIAAQLIQLRKGRLRPLLGLSTPGIFPNVLLVQAIRNKNWNSVSLLSFLCRYIFSMPDYLNQTSRAACITLIQHPESFLPSMNVIHDEITLHERTARSLKLRSAIALLLYI
jgi:hypothetical protein